MITIKNISYIVTSIFPDFLLTEISLSDADLTNEKSRQEVCKKVMHECIQRFKSVHRQLKDNIWTITNNPKLTAKISSELNNSITTIEANLDRFPRKLLRAKPEEEDSIVEVHLQEVKKELLLNFSSFYLQSIEDHIDKLRDDLADINYFSIRSARELALTFSSGQRASIVVLIIETPKILENLSEESKKKLMLLISNNSEQNLSHRFGLLKKMVASSSDFEKFGYSRRAELVAEIIDAKSAAENLRKHFPCHKEAKIRTVDNEYQIQAKLILDSFF